MAESKPQRTGGNGPQVNEWTISEVRGIVKRAGNGAHISLPKAWTGKKVVVRVE